MKYWGVFVFFLYVFPQSTLNAVENDQQIVAREDVIKAKMMLNFIYFSNWPQSNPSDDRTNNDPFTICIEGDNEILKPALLTFAKVSSSNNSDSLKVIPYQQTTRNACQMLFISSHDKDRLKRILHQLNNQPTLVFSDTPSFAELGSHINFYIKDSQVRFEINYPAVTKTGINISSRVLSLAKLVGVAQL